MGTQNGTPLQRPDDSSSDDETDPIKIFLPEPTTTNSISPTPPLRGVASAPELQRHHLRSISSTVVTRQLPSQGLSFQLWPAATTLVALLDRHKSDPTTSPLASTLNRPHALNILEIGSGTGLAGIAAAATLGADVTVTDLPHVIDNLKFNVDANKEVLDLNKGAVHVAPLRWGEDGDAEELGRGFDVILASDVVYHDHLYEPLIKTLRWFLCGGKGQKEQQEEEEEVVFLMAHLKRWKKESAFFRSARKLFNVDVVHVDQPCAGSRVGVVVYRFTGKDQRSGATA